MTWSLEQAHSGALAVDDLAEQTSATQARRDRASARRLVQSGGVVTASQAREIIAEKLEIAAVKECRRQWIVAKRKVDLWKARGWGKVLSQLRRQQKAMRIRLDREAEEAEPQSGVDHDQYSTSEVLTNGEQVEISGDESGL